MELQSTSDSTAGPSKRPLADSDEEVQTSAAPAKKPRKSTNAEDLPPPTLEDILQMSSAVLKREKKERLVIMVEMLQAAFKGEGPSTLTPAIPQISIDKEVEKLRMTVRRGIEKQMKWVPSAKTGKAKWSYDGLTTCDESFRTLFLLSEGFNKKKFNIDTNKFETKILDQRPEGKVRYDILYITSGEVVVRWDAETKSFTVSGTYGKSAAF